jgi:hypothetical protein
MEHGREDEDMDKDLQRQADAVAANFDLSKAREQRAILDAALADELADRARRQAERDAR